MREKLRCDLNTVRADFEAWRRRRTGRERIPDALWAAAIGLLDHYPFHLGNGDGTFGEGQHFAVGAFPRSVAVGDFNGDAIPDLAVANSFSHTVSIRLGVGDGTFAAAPDIAVSGHPTAVTIGDFNGDKLLDLAVASATTNNISILLGAGDGTFRIVRPFGVGRAPRSIVVGDFNGDGRPDLAVANLGHVDSYSVSILINDTADPFAP